VKRLAKDGAAAPLERLPPRADQPESGARLRADRLAGFLTHVSQQLHDFLSSEDDRLRDRKLLGLAEFAAGAAHEINTPLAIISGQAQQLLRSERDSERTGALKKIISQTQRIHALLRDLMLYARPPVLACRSMELEPLLKRIMREYASLAKERGVRLDRTGSHRRLVLRADPALLEAAVGCLVQNGIEAAPVGGWVRIGCTSQTRHSLVISVEDNGPGLTAAQREHGFDPFYSGRTAGRGVGLGLSKVWRIAQLHGGDVRVTSGPYQTTRFELTLPALAQGAPRRLKIRRPSASVNGHVNGRLKRRPRGHRQARR
jgi:signal transduction histidine kinase